MNRKIKFIVGFSVLLLATCVQTEMLQGIYAGGETSIMDLEEQSSISTPSSGYGRIGIKTDKKIYLKDDTGTEYDLTQTAAMAQEDIDGALVGGASLKAISFSDIIKFKEA